MFFYQIISLLNSSFQCNFFNIFLFLVDLFNQKFYHIISGYEELDQRHAKYVKRKPHHKDSNHPLSPIRMFIENCQKQEHQKIAEIMKDEKEVFNPKAEWLKFIIVK